MQTYWWSICKFREAGHPTTQLQRCCLSHLHEEASYKWSDSGRSKLQGIIGAHVGPEHVKSAVSWYGELGKCKAPTAQRRFTSSAFVGSLLALSFHLAAFAFSLKNSQAKITHSNIFRFWKPLKKWNSGLLPKKTSAKAVIQKMACESCVHCSRASFPGILFWLWSDHDSLGSKGSLAGHR